MRALFGLNVNDIDCAFKLFRREVLDAVPVQSVGAFINTELLLRAQSRSFKIKQLPVSHYPRRAGEQSGANPQVILTALYETVRLYGELR